MKYLRFRDFYSSLKVIVIERDDINLIMIII